MTEPDSNFHNAVREAVQAHDPDPQTVRSTAQGLELFADLSEDAEP